MEFEKGVDLNVVQESIQLELVFREVDPREGLICEVTIAVDIH